MKETEDFRVLINVMRLKKAVSGLCVVSRNSIDYALRKGLRRWRYGKKGKTSIPKAKVDHSPDPEQRMVLATAENYELQRKISKLKAKLKPSIDQSVQELIEENQKLREKVQMTEQNVGVFIKEMANLLDQHEPPGLRAQETEEQVPRPPSKSKKLVRPKARVRVATYSPERIEEKGVRKANEKRRLQFD